MNATAMNVICPLCQNQSAPFYRDEFFLCDTCKGVFRDQAFYPSLETEKSRYEEHNNDVNDSGYQQFVSPIIERVAQDFSSSHSGLDFGSGTGPVASKLLQDKGYHIEQYDPFFADFPSLLARTYDYIVCCEVVEHFHYPAQDFGLLKKLLNPEGKLYCMTNLYHADIDFPNWHYQRDPTHVFIYQRETMEWISKKFGFKSVEIEGRLSVFSL